MNVYVKSKYLVYFYLFNMCLSVFLLLNNSLTVINKKKLNFDINILHGTVKSIFLFYIMKYSSSLHHNQYIYIYIHTVLYSVTKNVTH
jgi:hypothetical protein